MAEGEAVSMNLGVIDAHNHLLQLIQRKEEDGGKAEVPTKEFSPSFTSDEAGALEPLYNQAAFEECVDTAHRAGVSAISVSTTEEAEWRFVQALRHAKVSIYHNIGVHPWFVKAVKDGWQQRLIDALRRNNSLGVGEIGLDKSPHGMEVDLDVQKEAFQQQLNIAFQERRRVVIHCVRACADLITCLNAVRKKFPCKAKPRSRSGSQKAAHHDHAMSDPWSADNPCGALPVPVILHSYSGSAQQAAQLLDLGCWFSFSGMVTIPTFKRLRDAAAVLPLSRMLVETDAPDQPPRGITEKSARDFAAAVAGAKSRAAAVEAAATTLGTLGYQPLMSKEREEKGAEEEAKDESRGAPAGSGDSTAGPFKRPTIATEPAHVWPVMAELSRMKGIPLCEVLETTAANARAVFAWQYQSEDKA